jgi:hypothetical protein
MRSTRFLEWQTSPYNGRRIQTEETEADGMISVIILEDTDPHTLKADVREFIDIEALDAGSSEEADNENDGMSKYS